MSLLEQLDALAEKIGHDAKRFAEQAVAAIEYELQQHPQAVLALLRTLRPVSLRHGVAVVTRFPDVRDVLTSDQEFSVAGYRPPMQAITGDFILGLDGDARYDRDVSLLRLAFRRDDVDAIAAFAAKAAAEVVAKAAPEGRIDVVRDLTDRVPARFVASYLGTPGPDEDTLIRWARAMFAEIFVNLRHDRIITEEAMTAAGEARPYLDAVVASRKAAAAARNGGTGIAGPSADGAPAPVSGDVLGRLLEQQRLPGVAFGDAEIRSNLIGLFVGAIPTTSKATALALDELLRRPRELAGAQDAARTGDDALLSRYLLEAMRFAPQAPGLFRHAAVDCRIAAGTRHETRIPAGSTVFVSLQSAMLDGDVLDDPEEFRLDRPDHHYLHFGAGLHTCFGRYVNQVQIPQIAKALLRRTGLRRAEGAAGELSMNGNFPQTMTVEFDPVDA